VQTMRLNSRLSIGFGDEINLATACFCGDSIRCSMMFIYLTIPGDNLTLDGDVGDCRLATNVCISGLIGDASTDTLLRLTGVVGVELVDAPSTGRRAEVAASLSTVALVDARS
jgi:hypothetical protein